MEFLRSILRRHLVGKPALSVWVGSGYSLPGWGNQSWRRRYVDCFHTLILEFCVVTWNSCYILSAFERIRIKICFWIEECQTLKVRSIGMIRIRISDPRSLGSWCVKGTIEFILGKYSSVHLINVIRDHSYHWSWMRIIPRERTLNWPSKVKR